MLVNRTGVAHNMNQIIKNTHHNAVPYRVVCCRWARADRGTLPSTRCKATCPDRRRSVVARDTRYCRRPARLLSLKQ